jgi:hyperosmotically inducible protein
MMRLCAALSAIVVATACGGGGRPVQVQPQAVEDAQVGVRVKTALVNDPQLGPRVIEVRVSRGLVILSGQVNSADEAARAIDLARAVPGVTDVRSQLVVRDVSAVEPRVLDQPRGPPGRLDDEIASASRRRLLAVGASFNSRQASDDRLDAGFRLGPLVRLGGGRGLGLTFGFSWFRADLSAGPGPGEAMEAGRVTIRPLMAGAQYTFTDRARWSLGASLVGGLALNSFAIEPSSPPLHQIALDVDNSLALRPGVSLWLDLNSRVAVNFFSGYVFTRPQMTFLENGAFVKRQMRADTAVFDVGVVYKLF